MKVYVVTDLEGVAGITQWDPRHQGDTPATAATRAKFAVWLAEEVNAATRGFFAGGATEVIVNDGHGAGMTMDVEVLDRIRRRNDSAEYGGAPLLGVDGICIIGHGSSNARAVYNAIRVARGFGGQHVNKHIAEAI